jgi:hypothetical protein
MAQQFFYDAQLRRFLIQFMRIVSNFEVEFGKDRDGTRTLQRVPVYYGDPSRQAATILRQNSENIMNAVPAMSAYISAFTYQQDRMQEPYFVSKMHMRERQYDPETGLYNSEQGDSYTIERLMPVPYNLEVKLDIWTSNTEQKMQLIEQLAVLFNPAFEIQSTDNYIDWTSLSALYLTSTNFSSRTIPQGADSDIDICSLEFEVPIYITPPAKVKKLGIVQSIVANVFTDDGAVANLEDLIYDNAVTIRTVIKPYGGYSVLLFKSNTGNPTDNQYDLTLVNPSEAVIALGLDEKEIKNGEPIDWDIILNVQGGYMPGSEVYFKKASGYEIVGTFVINPLDQSILTVTLDADTYPANDDIASSIPGVADRGTVDAIIDPYKYNPLEIYGSHTQIPLGLRFLMLDDVNNSENREGFINLPSIPGDPSSSNASYDGPDGWKNTANIDPVITVNSIVEWTGQTWATIWNPDDHTLEAADIAGEEFVPTYIQNIRTGIKYKWDGEQWIKAFEGEYRPEEWNFKIIG